MSLVSIGHRCVGFNIRRAAQAVTQYYDQHLQASGLRISQFSLLVAISQNDEISISELGDKICKDQTTITRNIELLKKQEYITITRKENDARKKAIRITEAGKKKLAEVMPLWENAQTHIEKELGLTRLNDFFRTLKSLEELVK